MRGYIIMGAKIKINENFLKIKESYLFSDIAKKVSAYSAAHPDKEIIRLGIGDVTLPLTESVTKAMHRAVDEQASKSTFRGYAPLTMQGAASRFPPTRYLWGTAQRATSEISPIFSATTRFLSRALYIPFMSTQIFFAEEKSLSLIQVRRTDFFPSRRAEIPRTSYISARRTTRREPFIQRKRSGAG